MSTFELFLPYMKHDLNHDLTGKAVRLQYNGLELRIATDSRVGKDRLWTLGRYGARWFFPLETVGKEFIHHWNNFGRRRALLIDFRVHPESWDEMWIYLVDRDGFDVVSPVGYPRR